MPTPRFLPLAALLALSIGLSAASPAFAADTNKLLGKFGVWQAYSYGDKGGKVCYAGSHPAKSEGAPKDRKSVAITVTHTLGDKSFNVVSIESGLALKKGAAADMLIGGAKFDLYTQGGNAWTRDDKAAVAAMLKGRLLVSHLTPAKGAVVADSFDLSGFAQAHDAINKACNVK